MKIFWFCHGGCWLCHEDFLVLSWGFIGFVMKV